MAPVESFEGDEALLLGPDGVDVGLLVADEVEDAAELLVGATSAGKYSPGLNISVAFFAYSC
jgi:hypothetical protein